MTNITETITYLSGDSGRIVCTRVKGCAGATLTATMARYPIARAWRGLNGEPFQKMTDADIEVIRQITGGTVCDCEY
jgi:hypothetical protein